MLWTCAEDGGRLAEEQASDRNEVQPRQGGGQPLEVFDLTPKLRYPRETVLHEPAAGQGHEAAFGLRVLDYLQTDAMSLRFSLAGRSPV